MNPGIQNRPPMKDAVRSYIERGMILSSKYSTNKLTSASNSVSFFSGEESKNGYPNLQNYNSQGKNPLETQTGKILGLSLDSFRDNFLPINYAGASNDYAVLDALTAFLNQLIIEVRVNKDVVREFVGIEAHKPLPIILKHFKVGEGVSPANVTLAAIMPPSGSIETDRDVLRLPIDIKNNDSIQIIGRLKNGTAGSALQDHLLVMRMLTVELPSDNK